MINFDKNIIFKQKNENFTYSKENIITEGPQTHIRQAISNNEHPSPKVAVDNQKSAKNRKLELTSSSLNTCKMKQYISNNPTGRLQSPQGASTQGSLRKTSPEYRSFTSGGEDSVERHQHMTNTRNTSVSGSHLEVYNTLCSQISDEHTYVNHNKNIYFFPFLLICI